MRAKWYARAAQTGGLAIEEGLGKNEHGIGFLGPVRESFPDA